jgi:hypothetical protein
MPKHRIVGISFDHVHMGDLLRESNDHPNAEIVGVCDPDVARMADAVNGKLCCVWRVVDQEGEVLEAVAIAKRAAEAS